MLVLLHETEWGAAPHLKEAFSGFEVTLDQSRYKDADVVIFHLPEWFGSRRLNRKGTAGRVKLSGQIWVGWSRECILHYPHMTDPQVLAQFDIMATYQRGSDVPLSYLDNWHFVSDLEDQFRSAHVNHRPSALVNMFISSDYNLSGRRSYAFELARHMAIDSYGQMMRNQKIAIDDGPATKRNIISSYKFTLAFENAISPDYVTEKFFEPLLAGSIPIYLGAPNVQDFAPGDHCYIDVRDFPDPKDLANFLTYVAADEDLFEGFYAWKRADVLPSFRRLLEERSTHWIERLMGKVASLQR